jgi:hypothetical protein
LLTLLWLLVLILLLLLLENRALLDEGCHQLGIAT